MNIVIQIRDNSHFRLLYVATKFRTGLTVTGYLIYPDATKSGTITFDELGDGIYTQIFPYVRKTRELDEKYGVVMKEDGKVKGVDFIKMIN